MPPSPSSPDIKSELQPTASQANTSQASPFAQQCYYYLLHYPPNPYNTCQHNQQRWWMRQRQRRQRPEDKDPQCHQHTTINNVFETHPAFTEWRSSSSSPSNQQLQCQRQQYKLQHKSIQLKQKSCGVSCPSFTFLYYFIFDYSYYIYNRAALPWQRLLSSL